MKRIFLFVALMLFLGRGASINAKKYTVEEIRKPKYILEYKEIKTPKGVYIVIFEDGVKDSRREGKFLVTDIIVIPPDYQHIPTSKVRYYEDKGSIPPQVDQIIYHDLEGTGKPDFCSMIYHEVKVNAEGQRVSVNDEMILPDEVAEEILKVVNGYTQWKTTTNHEWFKLVKTPELKGFKY